ncbi:hypothetical protein DL767_003077 [Monosporascus sp. MG133]|nr:hypothetical protein DL767_003077 [Monosporascus sp. MG133]
MEVRPLLRPLSALATSTTTTTTTAAAACNISRAVVGQRRQQSTASRTKKALKIPPHPSFLTPPSGASHVVFNPPPSAPSVYHTPFKFLPKSDPRRQANLAQLLLRNASSPYPTIPSSLSSVPTSSSSTSEDPAAELPPTLTADEHERSQPRRNVTREQVEEMRALRAEDPATWSVHKLAARFGCTPWFVMMCCKSSAEHRAAERTRKEAIRARWGPGRALAREERRKRKALLLRGEL